MKKYDFTVESAGRGEKAYKKVTVYADSDEIALMKVREKLTRSWILKRFKNEKGTPEYEVSIQELE